MATNVPGPLQAVLLFQNHQTTTPFAPSTPTSAASTMADPVRPPVKKREEEQEEEPEQEQEEDEDDDQEEPDNGKEH